MHPEGNNAVEFDRYPDYPTDTAVLNLLLDHQCGNITSDGEYEIQYETHCEGTISIVFYYHQGKRVIRSARLI